MQLKRDTEYALRIMVCMAEHLKDQGRQTGMLSSDVISGTEIPIVIFNRICECLEAKGLIQKKTGRGGDKYLYPGKDFWKQSIYSIAEAVEGNMEIFTIFNENSHFIQSYGKDLMDIQKGLKHLLSKVTLECMVGSRD